MLLPFCLEDSVTIGFIVSIGLNLVARVVAGTCPKDTTFYGLQQCNPIMYSIPTESFIILYACPLLAIKLIRTVSLMGLLVSWCLIIGFVTFAVVYTQAWSQIWALVFSIFFLCITVDSERSIRVAFLHVMDIEHQKATMIEQLRAKHATERSLAKV